MSEPLTSEQIARFPEFDRKWTRIGLSTEPADRPRAEAAIESVYNMGHFSSLPTMMWFDSPNQMINKYKKNALFRKRCMHYT
jgi:hypothetical protein